MFREGENLSWSRISGAALIATYIIASLFTVFTADKPELPDIPVQLAGMVLVLYGINKAAAVLNKGK